MHRIRKLTQVLFLIVLILLPMLDIFRLDMADSRFVILGNYFFINQLYLALIAFVLSLLILALTARLFGRVFCGWLCFQTFWSELGGKILGFWSQYKKAKKAKRKYIAFTKAVVLFAISLVMMLGFYTLLVSYFVAPKTIWAWITLGPPLWFFILFLKFAVLGIIDLLILRHSFCASMCPYGIMQQKSKKNTSMHITFNEEHCIDCGLCDRACPMNLKPRELKLVDPCINCAECIVACGVKGDKLFAVKGNVKGALNSLSYGLKPLEADKPKLPFLDKNTLLLGAIFAAFTAILLVGVILDDGIDFTIKLKTDVSASATVESTLDVPYELKITNRKKDAQQFQVMVQVAKEGTPPGKGGDYAFTIQPDAFSVDALSTFEQSVLITPDQTLPSGRYTITVHLLDPTGKEVDVTKTVYYVY